MVVSVAFAKTASLSAVRRRARISASRRNWVRSEKEKKNLLTGVFFAGREGHPAAPVPGLAAAFEMR
jgi:hypothetical protein